MGRKRQEASALAGGAFSHLPGMSVVSCDASLCGEGDMVVLFAPVTICSSHPRSRHVGVVVIRAGLDVARLMRGYYRQRGLKP